MQHKVYSVSSECNIKYIVSCVSSKCNIKYRELLQKELRQMSMATQGYFGVITNEYPQSKTDDGECH